MEQRRSHLARLGAVISLVALVVGVRALPSAAVQPELVLPPERLYTPVDWPIAFVGTDSISGDARELDVTATVSGCAPTSGNGWALTGCARVQLEVGHGTLAIPLETVLGGAGAGEPEGIVAGGAIIDESTNADGTGLVIYLNGTEAQLDDALALLTYTPDSGYEYDGTNPETLQILVADGTAPADNVSHDVEIRVQQVNDAPTLTVPTQAAVASGGTVSLPAVAPPVGVDGDLYIDDPDIADGEADTDMLLALRTTCGEVSLRGGALTLGTNVEDLLLAQGHPQEVVDAVVAALPLPVTAQVYATGGVTDPHTALLAVGQHDELDYALSQIDFDAPAGDGTCVLSTVVTDLGNNGRPGTYEGSPIGGRDQPQPGIEIPDVGVASGLTTFVVGGGVEMGIPTTLSIGEGDALTIPVSTSSAVHPAVDLLVTAVGVTATGGGVDYDEPTSPVTLPEGAASVDLALTTVEDADDEGDETATVSLALQGAPPGLTLTDDTVTVTIVDDDGADTTKPTVTIDQAAGQSDPDSVAPILFDVEFSEPVTGFANGDVDLSASNAGGPLLVSNVIGSGTTYTVEVTGMTATGDVEATIPAGAATDGSGNTSEASTSTDNVVGWVDDDMTPPLAGIDEAPGQVDPTSTAPITFRIELTEAVTGLTAADIDTSASTVGGTLAVAVTEIDAATYDVEVTGMTTAGDVVIDLPAQTVTDLAGNANGPTTIIDATVTWDPPADVTAPTVTVEQAVDQDDPTSVSPIRFDVTFGEPVTGFDETDLDLTGSTAGGTLAGVVTGSGSSYAVSVTGMTTAGDLVLAVGAGAAVDAASNPNEASTSLDDTVTWSPSSDITVPTVVVDRAAGQADPTSVAPIRFDVTFSEPVTGFDEPDLLLAASTAGGTLVATVEPRTKADGTSFVVSITGMTTDGDVSLAVVGGAAVDAAGNESLASTGLDDVVAWDRDTFVPIPDETYTPTYGPSYDPSPNNYYPNGYSGPSDGADGSYLPRTGLDLAGVLAVAIGAIGLGFGLVLAARRPWGTTG